MATRIRRYPHAVDDLGPYRGPPLSSLRMSDEQWELVKAGYEAEAKAYWKERVELRERLRQRMRKALSHVE